MVRCVGVLLMGAAMALSGCATAPTYVKCKGDAEITGQAGALVYSGQFALAAKCGEGFEYSRERVSAPEP